MEDESGDESGDESNHTLCLLCDKNPVEVAFSPCGHFCICSKCAGNNLRRCPVCANPARQIVNITFPYEFGNSQNCLPDSSVKCVICLNNPPNVACMPCGHIWFCDLCMKEELLRTICIPPKLANCLVCSNSDTPTLKIYMVNYHHI